jgi:hypothetical protein
MSFYKGFETAMGALTGALVFIMIMPLAIIGIILFLTGN